MVRPLPNEAQMRPIAAARLQKRKGPAKAGPLNQHDHTLKRATSVFRSTASRANS